MNKMAIFVEGYTEAVFVEKLVLEIAEKNAVLIEWRKIRGGTNTPRTMRLVQAAQPNTGQKHFVLIFDCGGDDAVKTRMMQEYDNLAKAKYTKIVCIRDVGPTFTHADIPTLEANLPKYVKTKPIVVDFILSILEVEAWFLAEATHYPKIDPVITVAAIKTALGFDPENDDMQMRLKPADDLNNCYAIGGKTYEKHQAKATVDSLDFALVYLSLVDKFSYLKKLVAVIETFLKT